MKVVRQGNNICPGAIETYLTVFPQGEESIKFYTPFSSVRWEIVEKVKNEPQGQYWVLITYQNTGTKHPTYGCGETKHARIYGTQNNGSYNLVKGEILDIVLTKESYEAVASYKLQVKNINHYVFKHQLVDSQTGNRSLQSESKCNIYKPSAAFPGSVRIEDVIPITGGYEYEFKVFDQRGFVFSKVFAEIPTIDDYCVFPERECPPGTCRCDCGSSHVCCYDSKTGEVVTSFLK